MGWLNGILPQNAICLTGVNNGILNHLRDMGVVPLLVTSDSANPGQPDAFPNLFMAPRQGSRETSVDIHACMPSRCRFHFHLGNSRKEGRGRWKRQYGSCLACQDSQQPRRRCTCLRGVCATATCKTCKVISRAELRRRQRRGRDAAFLHNAHWVYGVSTFPCRTQSLSSLSLKSLHLSLVRNAVK